MSEKLAASKPAEVDNDVNLLHDCVWTPIKPHEASIGDCILIASACYDDSEPRRLLSEGARGTIASIDSDGDYRIHLQDDAHVWIFRNRISLLMLHTTFARISADFENIASDFKNWRLRATDE